MGLRGGLFWVLATCVAWAEPLKVFYLANRQGEVEPCGCAAGQAGGLDRLYTFLEKESRKVSSLILDAGDTFFATEALPTARQAQDLLAAKLIARSYKKMGVEALCPGEKDFAAGIEALRQLQEASGAAFVAVNLEAEDGKPLFERYRIFQKGPHKVAVIGVVEPSAYTAVKGVRAAPIEGRLREAIAAARNEGANRILLLSHSGLSHDRLLAQKEIDAIFGAHSLDGLNQPERAGDTASPTWIVQPMPRGQQVGVLEFREGRHQPPRHELVDLDERFLGSNVIGHWVQEHKREVSALAADPQSPGAASSEKPFVGHPETCRKCHRAQYEFWQKTKHASAYLVLYAKGQHFDPECVGCHTLGFEQEGGFSKVALPVELKSKATKQPFVEQVMKAVFAADPAPGKELDSRIDPKRYLKLKKRYHAEIEKVEKTLGFKKNFLGVQCEHCHGNRHGHPGSETVKKVAESACLRCHVPPRDLSFSFAAVNKVACPRIIRK